MCKDRKGHKNTGKTRDKNIYKSSEMKTDRHGSLVTMHNITI